MRSVLLKSLLGQKARLIGSVIAIAIGLAFITGTALFIEMMRNSFASMATASIPQISVAPKGSYDNGNNPLAEKPIQAESLLTHSQITNLNSTPGVSLIKGVLSSNNLRVLDAENNPMGLLSLPAFGGNYLSSSSYTGAPTVELKTGDYPKSTNEVVLDEKTARSGGFQIKDLVRVSGPLGVQDFVLVGTFALGEDTQTSATTYVYFTDAGIQRLLFGTNRVAYHSVWVGLEPNADLQTVAAALAERIPDGYQVYTGDQIAASTEDYLNHSIRLLWVLAVIVLLVGCVFAGSLINAAFNTLIATRSRELAVFRVLGATPGQIRRAVLWEALLVGAIGGAIGVLLGFAFALVASVLDNNIGPGFTTPRFPEPLQFAVIVGGGLLIAIGLSLLAALPAARRAGTLSPIESLDRSLTAPVAQPKRRGLAIFALILGLVAIGLAAGASFLPDSFPVQLPYPFWVCVGGIVLTLAAVLRLASQLGKPLLSVVSRVCGAFFGGIGKVARVCLQRDPARVSQTAASVISAVTIVATLAVLGGSATASVDENLRNNARGDYVVSAVGYGALSTQVYDQLSANSDFSEVAMLRSIDTETADGASVQVFGYHPNSFDRVYPQQLVEGRVMSRKGEAMLSEGYADTHGLRVGATVQIKNPVDGSLVDLEVVGVFATESGVRLGSISVTSGQLSELGNAGLADLMSVYLSDRGDQARGQSYLESLFIDSPNILIQSQTDYLNSAVDSVQQYRIIVYAVLGLVGLMAALAVLNALFASVNARTRDIGIMQVLGMTRTQTRRLINAEAITVTVFACILGLILGTGFGFALQRVLVSFGLVAFRVPWLPFVITLGACVLIGVFASLAPARTAAQGNLLRHLVHD